MGCQQPRSVFLVPNPGPDSGSWCSRAFLKHRDLWTLSDRGNEQVIAPLLIIVQVANRRAFTGDVVSRNVVSIPSSRGESTAVNGTTPSARSASLTGVEDKVPGELGVRVVTTVDFHHDTEP